MPPTSHTQSLPSVLSRPSDLDDDETSAQRAADRAEALEVIAFVDPVVLAAVLGRSQPTAPLLVAARVGVEVADLRHAHWIALRDTSKQVSAAYTAAGLAHQPSLTELLRRRYPPNGDVHEWIHGQAAA